MSDSRYNPRGGAIVVPQDGGNIVVPQDGSGLFGPRALTAAQANKMFGGGLETAIPKNEQSSIKRQEMVLARLKRLGSKDRGRPEL